MSPTSYRGWRFRHPEHDPEGREGLQSTPQGHPEMVEGAQAVRQSILLLLSTRPGERVMRPEYGCDLHSLAFDTADETAAGVAIHLVREAVERWEPRAEILGVDASLRDAGEGRLVVTLDYRVRQTGETDRLVYSLSLGGEES